MTLDQINDAIRRIEQDMAAFVGGSMGMAKQFEHLNNSIFCAELTELVGEHYHDALTRLCEDRDRIIAGQQDAERLAALRDYDRSVL